MAGRGGRSEESVMRFLKRMESEVRSAMTRQWADGL